MPVTAETVKVLKRDNKTLQNWDIGKVRRAISASCTDVHQEIPKEKFDQIIENVTKCAVEIANADSGKVTVEQIQKLVKMSLTKEYYDIAEAYITYAFKRDEARKKRSKPDTKLMSDFIHLTRYARHIKELKRRETFEESIQRIEKMHLKKYPIISAELKEAFEEMRAKRVLPSMRSFQFGGEAQEQNNCKGFNCSFLTINRIKAFSEAFYLGLSGVGVGYSVQWRHVEALPELGYINKDRVKHFVIPDTIEGWADAVHELITSYTSPLKGHHYVEFSYHQIRPQGTELKTSGGRAPGHLGLKNALESVRKVLDEPQVDYMDRD